MANADSDLQAKINQLSTLENNMQQFSVQKQQFQAQLMEMESAETELKDAKESYRIIGSIMVLSDKSTIQKEISEKKELLKKRIDSFEKQETKLRERAEALQKEVLESMKKEGGQ